MITQYGGADPILVNGSITGIRRFRARADGRLTGPHFDSSVITPGVNTATCQIRRFWGNDPAYVSVQQKFLVASKHCTCGFYAYHSPNHDEYAFYKTIRAVVAGTGRVTVGSLGFRAEKIELLGYVNPTLPKSGTKHGPLYWINTQLIKSSASFKHSVALLAFTLVSVLLSFLLENDVFTIMCWASVAANFARGFGVLVHMGRVHRLKKTSGVSWEEWVIPWDEIAKQYPDAKTFRTVEEMLEEFPLTKQLHIT
jgi:hypothetical protein